MASLQLWTTAQQLPQLLRNLYIYKLFHFPMNAITY